MNINFDDRKLSKMQEVFNELGESALFMSHYDLSQITEDYTPADWKRFLTHPEVSDWITAEMRLVQQSKVRKMINTIDRSNSTGQAQLLNTLLSSLKEDNKAKDGPAFVYCYIPLNEEEQQAENVQILQIDPFLLRRGLKHDTDS